MKQTDFDNRMIWSVYIPYTCIQYQKTDWLQTCLASNLIINITWILNFRFSVCIYCSANLSESYFTDRQDRYILFNECGEMADFFSSVVNGVAASSFVLHADNSVSLSPHCKAHPFDGLYFGWANWITRALHSDQFVIHWFLLVKGFG